MEQLLKKVSQIIRNNKKQNWVRGGIMSAACLVVFMTTYLLILPAITISLDQADEEPGFDVEAQGELLLSDGEQGGNDEPEASGSKNVFAVPDDANEMDQADLNVNGDTATLFGEDDGDSDEVFFSESGGSGYDNDAPTASGETAGPFEYTYSDEETGWQVTVSAELLGGAVLPSDAQMSAKFVKVDTETEQDTYKELEAKYSEALKASEYENTEDPIFYQLLFEKDGETLITEETYAPARITFRFYEPAPQGDISIVTGEYSSQTEQAEMRQTLLIPENNSYTIIADVENAASFIGVSKAAHKGAAALSETEEVQFETEIHTHQEEQSVTEIDPETEAEPGAEVQFETDAVTETEADTAIETEAETVVETETETVAETETEAAAETEAESKTAVETEEKAETGNIFETVEEEETESATETTAEEEAENVTETGAEEETECVTEAPEEETEGATEAAVEEETEGITEAATAEEQEGITEAITEDTTESKTEAETEEETEALESVYEDELEEETESITEEETEEETESISEAETEGLLSALTYEGTDYTITLNYGADAEIPEDAFLEVREIEKGTEEYDMYLAASGIALENEGMQNGTAENVEARFFDITIMREDGKIEPKGAVSVDIVYHEALKVAENGEVNALHFDDKGETSVLEANPQGDGGEISSVSFDTDSFSVFGIVYTVDFHYEINGKMYEFSIPGGGFVSLEHVVEVLGIATADENSENGAENAENDPENADDFVGEVPGVDVSDENSTAYEEAIKLNEVEVSEATKKFVADVVSVEFSNPELVWVGKVDSVVTVGGLKEANGLEVQYSAELTEEQITEINAQTVEAGDWALISVQPFTREETLTVTMKNGDQFVVRVTDAQISTHVITADGEDYLITVTYGPEAEIPDGSRLEAKEILADTEKYESMLEQSINVLSEGGNTEIVFSRFFDISILNEEGIEIEPAKPVDVSIQYTHPIDMEGAKPSVVHFADNGIEVIQPETRLSGDGKEGTINVFEYEQGSFSGVGTIIETDTLEDGQYFLVVGDNGSYYAMKNDGSLVPVTYYHQTKQVEAAPGVNENDLLWNVSGVGYGYYTFKAVNGDNYLSLQNGSVVNNSSANVLVRHNSWDESQNETGGYYIYHTPNPWDSNTWNPLRLGYWDNASHFYVGEDNSNPQRIKLYKYAMASSTGEPPVTNTYTGIEVNPSELDEWLMSLFDDMPVGDDGYHKTAEVYDYENRIYQIDFTAQSNAQGFASDIDIAFSVDMSNSMLFPSTMTSIGTIELKQSVLESTLEKDQVYFVISDVKGTATVNALYYDEGGRGEWYNGQYYTVPAGWRFEDASKYARGQRKAAHQTDSDANLDKYVEDYTGFKIQGTDTGFYTLYKADEGYLNYINSSQSVYENPYNRLADMKDSLRMAFNFLDVMSEKYHCKVRVGWNGFAKDVVDGNNYDYRCRENNHTLKDLSQVDYRTILTGITQAGNQTGGGTRPDKAFIDAANMGWGNNTQKYLILITDGAPQGGGASSAAAALTLGKNEGRNLTNTQGVNIVSIGLSTEHVDAAASLFEYISCQDPNPGSDQQMIYQAKDGDALKNAVVDALRIMVTKAITVGTIKDTIDPAFYPVSTDGTPLKSGDKIDLNGKLTTDTSKPYGTIGWDANNKCWTVEWKEQDFAWPDEEHPHGWHGRVLVKAKENFLGGNDISTNKGQASLDVIKAKVPVKNPDGSWRFQDTSFQSLMNVTNDQLQTRYMDTPHVNVDELEMTKNDTEWTVYLNTEVDPGEQMEALFNEIKVMKVVTDGEHEMVVPDGKTAKDVMVYDLVPTENGNYSYEEASSDARDKRNVDQAFFYLKDLFSMKDSLNNDFIIDNMTAEQAIAKLLAGEKVEVKYQGYGHGTTDKPVGKIILELKADPSAQVNNLDSHNASPVGNAVEKYILSAEYKPTPEEGSGDWYWNTGTFGTKDRGKVAEDKIKYNTHIINVIKRILTIQKVNSDGNPITDADAGEAQFEIYQKDTSGSKINSSTVTTSGLSYTWDYVVPDEDQKKPGDYWVDNTTYYIKEVKAPKGYAAFDGEITVTLGIEDTATDIPNLGDNEKVPYNWEQTATLGASGDSNYVTVTGSPDITIAVKNDKSIDITVIKTDTDNVEIPGAKFSITKGSAIQTDIKVIKKGGSWDNEEDRINVENGVFTIPAGGVTVLGLGAGDYTLTETEPPAGYIKTLRAIKFTAGRDGTVTYTNAADNPEPKVKPANDNKQYTVQNEPGAALPNTGGPGTTTLYLLGIMLTAFAGTGLVMRKRRRDAA